ncbi:junctional sarcoplasmic reticulum protein 1 [Alligator mississippiensis]|uniref:junctional sarcoplasmic reticulum protein 1 n=1 Tax=Alligator mississippiensis TaxID=8496 RepID=UPI00287727D3|nr:junctional sarcoplasmic reticulum protein 1 [Alligator mississippiensis]XP_019345478.2 junctional sarcoplasmic reticulum protein 1 [Alligator mississippiensis]XP_019345479.2 junctional sarcoplasmic reticulum protein 1 [Alligator mississippiensis]XP_019345480.2 junctional sarcoplasmic reticulum protein 1 [Alligator mississippiensis]XP_019345482.2 junctional sarcoplasmic reticulum protein 1 [Alligator mississippiensis]XP_019345483.2 junctional sarcoplasmic reticulum protein 1 [Alligator missi
MAAGPCEVLEPDLECPEAVEELPLQAEGIQRRSREDVREGTEVSQGSEEVNGTSHELGEEGNKLHIIETDLDEFVETMTETPPAEVEQKAKRTEKVAEKASSAVPPVPKALPVRRKTEPRTVGAAKEELLWDGLTLNKCILIASFIALLSMGFQVFQDVVEEDNEVPEAAPNLWVQPESSIPEDGTSELAEPWFLKRWLGRSEPEETEEPEAKAEETPEEPQAKAEPKKAKEKPREKPREKPERKEEKPRESRAAQVERGSKKEMQGKARPPEAKASRVPKEPQEDEEEEEEEEEQPWPRKRVRGEGKEGRRGERHRKEEGKGRAPRLEAPGREEHKRNEERKRDSKQQREHKGRKPWEQGPVLPRRDSNHKLREGKRHD